MSRMLGLTPSELGIVIFIFLLVVAAARLPSWGEAVGGYLHRRKASSRQGPPTDADAPKGG
jgi:Sec-independent protein translocase protein TatA